MIEGCQRVADVHYRIPGILQRGEPHPELMQPERTPEAWVNRSHRRGQAD
jgi:hypothetical protein